MSWHNLLLEFRTRPKFALVNGILSESCSLLCQKWRHWFVSLAQPSTLVPRALEKNFLEWFFWYMGGKTNFEILLTRQWIVAKRHGGIWKNDPFLLHYSNTVRSSLSLPLSSVEHCRRWHQLRRPKLKLWPLALEGQSLQLELDHIHYLKINSWLSTCGQATHMSGQSHFMGSAGPGSQADASQQKMLHM